jgi:hypothetical protein
LRRLKVGTPAPFIVKGQLVLWLPWYDPAFGEKLWNHNVAHQNHDANMINSMIPVIVFSQTFPRPLRAEKDNALVGMIAWSRVTLLCTNICVWEYLPLTTCRSTSVAAIMPNFWLCLIQWVFPGKIKTNLLGILEDAGKKWPFVIIRHWLYLIHNSAY